MKDTTEGLSNFLLALIVVLLSLILILLYDYIQENRVRRLGERLIKQTNLEIEQLYREIDKETDKLKGR